MFLKIRVKNNVYNEIIYGGVIYEKNRKQSTGVVQI